MVQELLLFGSLLVAVGYLAYRFRPQAKKHNCGPDCACDGETLSKADIDSR